MCLGGAQSPPGGSEHSRLTVCLVVFTLCLVVFSVCLVVFSARVKIHGPVTAWLSLCLVFICV